ncbi:MAG: hypothetical protein DI556_07255 [Rhodovulum sulfidophilum]|uniref:BrnA antitoxin family protein n=1 Tax=Rhodovulum sulfidophilum TaxID=35806 RepID=A0A2W5NCW6_RHOSU|nr:MAG: hypothetical protein DI556_07255 [Rhodovulum sulfidophilum]
MILRKGVKSGKGAPSEAARAADLLSGILALERWNVARGLKDRGMPEGWDELAWTLPARPAKTRVALALDADVAAWFEAFGPDRGERLNAVLRIYMLGMLSREIDAP